MYGSLVENIRLRQGDGFLPVLSEIKVRSPKEGDLLRGRDPTLLAEIMCKCQIAGLSVVTEFDNFGGDLDLIETLRPDVKVPILCKDFHKEVNDLKLAANVGADAVLLTVSMLNDEQIILLHETANSLGLETLLEIHSLAQLQRIIKLGIKPDILGINNRNILVFETDDGDVSLTEELASHIQSETLLLSESSIKCPKDARRARDAGADAVLVGTSILVANDTVKAINELLNVGWNGKS